MQTTRATDLRVTFETLMDEADAIAIDGPPERAIARSHISLTLLKEAMEVASELSPEQQSLFHAKVMLGMASVGANLGVALHDGDRLKSAMNRCDQALRLSVSLGTPEPRFEAEGLALRGNLFGFLGDYGAGIEHLEEVVATMEPAVTHFESLRHRGDPAAIAMLDMTGEDQKARELLDSARDSLREMRAAAAADGPEPEDLIKPWWKIW